MLIFSGSARHRQDQHRPHSGKSRQLPNKQWTGRTLQTCEMCLAITEDRAMDVIEIDAASNRGIDDIRDLREKVNYALLRPAVKCISSMSSIC